MPAVNLLGNQIPVDSQARAVGSLSLKRHEHSALVAHDGFHPSAEATEWARERVHVGQNAGLHETGQTPDHEVAQVARKSRLKRNGSDSWIPLGEELEVGNIAAPEPSLAERRRELVSAEVQSAIGVDPCPVLPRSDSLAAVAENTPHGGQSGRAGSGADSDADGLKSPEPWRVPIDHSRRKSRNGTRAADDRQPDRSEEHTSELQSHVNLVCRLLLEKKKKKKTNNNKEQEKYTDK